MLDSRPREKRTSKNSGDKSTSDEFDDTLELPRGHDPRDLSLEQVHPALPDLEFSAAEITEGGRAVADVSSSSSEDGYTVLNVESAQRGHEGLSLGRGSCRKLKVDLVSLCHPKVCPTSVAKVRSQGDRRHGSVAEETPRRRSHLPSQAKEASEDEPCSETVVPSGSVAPTSERQLTPLAVQAGSTASSALKAIDTQVAAEYSLTSAQVSASPTTQGITNSLDRHFSGLDVVSHSYLIVT